jgi:hypothetical protein
LKNTGNEGENWETKDKFEKQHGKFFPLEYDYGIDKAQQKTLVLWEK